MYQAELEKAKPFFDFVQYVEDKSVFVRQNLTLYYDLFNSKFNNMSQMMLDVCFDIVFRATDVLKSEALTRLTELNSYIDKADHDMKDVLTRMDAEL